MKNPVRRTAQIILSALFTAALCGCRTSQCEKLRDTCSKCTDPYTRDTCLIWANAGEEAPPGVSGNDVCAARIESYRAECR